MPISHSNKILIENYVIGFNRGDINAVCACFAEDALIFGVLGWGDLSKARPVWEQLAFAFQINLQIDSLVAEDSVVAVRYTERGTFAHAFREEAATGKTYEVVAMEWFEIYDNKIARRWGARDFATIARQIGLRLA